jgi:hypothetical protein
MSDYQKYWNAEIEKLLIELETSKDLHKQLCFVLSNSALTQIFPNQVINALKIALSIKNGEKNTALVAPMQSGKSGTAYVLCNYILPKMGFIKQSESVLFVTSMMDTDLFKQNKRNLEEDFYCVNDEENKSSFINVMKMSDFFNHPNPHKVVSEYKVKLIIRDEDQYGCGQESSFDSAFFSSLRSKMPNIKLLAISATPYDILDAKSNGYDVDVIDGERPEGYFGISEMIEEGLIEDYPEDFKPTLKTIVKGKDYFSIHPKLEEYINHLLSFDDGLGIIRVSNTNSAIYTRNTIRTKHKKSLECIVIGSNSECDFKIQDGLSELKNMVMKQKKKVILIVLHALSAGKDLRLLKEKVRFGIECRNKQLANGAQGIAGRLCGYHKNRTFKLMASMHLLKHYSQFEQDWEVFSDDDWKNELYNQKIKGLSTQTRFVLSQKAGVFIPIKEINSYSIDELLKDEVRQKLSYIDNQGYEKLLSCFKDSFHENKNKGYKFNQEGITVRIASNYNQESNRVYKNWNSGKMDDFGNVFFKKNTYEYGFLISNYPLEDSRNKIGFCGVKIFRSGEPYMCDQDTSTTNNSMYLSEENELTIDQHIGLMGTNRPGLT